MRKTIYCTLDTETVGGASNPTGMYNLGCVIHDKDGRIYATTSMLVMEHYDEIRNDDYAKKNFPIYEERLCKGEMTAVATEREAVEIVRNLCKMYNVKYVMLITLLLILQKLFAETCLQILSLSTFT